jgi:hypothetical protein
MNTSVAPATTPALRPAGRERACAQCTATFHPYRPSARFCSSLCRVRGHRGVTQPVAGITQEAPCNASEAPLWSTEQASNADEPQFIQSTHGEHRIYPRTYAEHGLPFPGYLMVKAR